MHPLPFLNKITIKGQKSLPRDNPLPLSSKKRPINQLMVDKKRKNINTSGSRMEKTIPEY
jgi:hypothetical protein